MRKLSNVFVFILIFTSYCALAQDGEHFGRYVVHQVQILKKDFTTVLPHEDLAIQVKLLNSNIVLELEAGNENEASVYQVLRKEEIKSEVRDGEEIISGIKAYQNTDGMIRHLLLTQEYLQITTFVPNSEIVRITHAKRTF